MNPKIISIDEARTLANAHGMRQLIVISWDGDLQYVTTYGQSLEDCDQAAMGGDKLKEVLGWTNVRPSFPKRVEKFRDALKKLSDYLGRPTDGDWSTLKDDDTVRLTDINVRVGDLKNAQKLVAEDPVYEG
jgi:hypothetical protein